jgi:Mg2+ and Co2+ transporter CorA
MAHYSRKEETMMGFSTAKLIGMGVGLIAVIGFVLMAFQWKGQAADRKEKLEAICTATRSAVNNPKLACGQVVVQITELGKSVVTLKQAVASQNAAVNALAAESARQQDEAAKASQKAEKRARGAEATADRLAASSHSSRSQGASCEPSKAVKEIWK